MGEKARKTVIIFNSIPYFLKYFNRDNVTASWALREISVLSKIVRKLTTVLNVAQSYWYADWKNNLESVDTIIIFAPIVQGNIINFIKKSNPKIRIIYWYWNPVFRVKKISKEKLIGVESWSFDPNDCFKYKMNFNNTFYFNEISLPENKIEYDAIFLGNDKGRGEFLKDLESTLMNKKLKTFFYIVPDKAQKRNNKKLKKMPYDQYLELVSKSKTIVDVIPKGQSGLTVRSMESLFLEKKLITTDLTIINQDFYSNNNIFIVGKDKEEDLLKFINSPYIPASKDILEKYNIDGWLKNFNF